MGFTKILTQDKNLQLVQDNINAALIPLQAIPMLGGNMLTKVILTAGQDNVINHKLSHAPQFFILSQQNADSRVWQTAVTDTTITLQCSNSCTVSLWVN